ncbi:MAG: DUF3857 domain-containing protein [Candidatus Pedobacter colombiensis]|uniref:DUF3857 domain-containing protein n=1 Tax=Candidatus Pedobacter colombiensis TaxID=3121371 RepID=A0AAJ5WA18_9SPHI|nr:DUF3857 domain-containing protein [Pedobacter sp.]WEK20797.1 MAG: DUF3857 domain-containing protein [Pedobacter sp.]
MNKRITLLVYLFTICTFSYAQENQTNKSKTFKYGKIGLEEFDIKVNGSDSAASAVALFDVGRGFFELSPKTGDFMYVFERHTRYKIINKSGYDYANLELQFYKQNSGETKLDYMDAATYNLEGGKIVTSKLNGDAKFSEKQDKNYTLKKFALPNVKEGSIVEYKYRISSDFIFTLRPWYFQRAIPTLYSQYDITIPEYYKYKVNAGGYLFLNPKQEMVNQTFFIKGQSLTAQSLHLHYQAENVPGLKRENYITTMEDYVSKIGFELSSITIPGQVYREVTSSWPKIVKGLKDDENFGSFIGKKSYSKTILKDIIKGETRPDTVMLMIFDYVKNNIKWNDKYSIYTSETNPKTIFEKKTGNTADINLCLLNLLSEANIMASPVLLSTRGNGTHPGIPMLTEFNNVIIQAEIGDKMILLDATDKDHTASMIAYDNLNHQGLKVNLQTENAAWISLEENRLSKKNISLMLTLNNENKLSGKLYLLSTHYEALNRRDKYRSATNETDFLKSYKTEKPGLGIQNYKIQDLNNLDAPLVETMDVVIEDNVEEAGNLAYFTPLLFERTKENPFKLEERKFPVDFAFPTEENYRINVDFPKGYQLDKTPKNERIVLPDDVASFTFIFAAEENKLMITSKITIKKAIYSPEEYYDLKELFKNIVRKQAEQIVFKKS